VVQWQQKFSNFCTALLIRILTHLRVKFIVWGRLMRAISLLMRAVSYSSCTKLVLDESVCEPGSRISTRLLPSVTSNEVKPLLVKQHNINIKHVRSEVLTMATIECTVFWDMTSCSLLEVHCFRGTWVNFYGTLQCQIQENSIFCNKVFQRNAFICKCQLQ
jgi:hypothetical protein